MFFSAFFSKKNSLLAAVWLAGWLAGRSITPKRCIVETPGFFYLIADSLEASHQEKFSEFSAIFMHFPSIFRKCITYFHIFGKYLVFAVDDNAM